MLEESLRRDGQTKPVLARQENLMLIAGHGVVAAAKRLGLQEMSVRLLDCDQATADRIMLADNRFSDLSSPDEDAVAELLKELSAEEFPTVGYTETEVEKLLGTYEELDVFEIKTSQVDDEFWITARGPLKSQAEVLARLKTLLNEYPDVEVSLGTIGPEP